MTGLLIDYVSLGKVKILKRFWETRRPLLLEPQPRAPLPDEVGRLARLAFFFLKAPEFPVANHPPRVLLKFVFGCRGGLS